MPINVLLTDPVPTATAERMRTMFPSGVQLNVVATSCEQAFAEAAREAEVLLVSHRQIGARELAFAPRVRFVQRVGAGFDNLDVAALRERGIAAAYAPGSNAVPLAEHAMLLMLALLKRFVATEATTRANNWRSIKDIDQSPSDLAGASVGLVGFGATGRALAGRLAGFGVRLRYTARHQAEPDVERALHASYLPLTELLGWSTIVSLHVPLTEETHHLMSDAQFGYMRPGSLLINTSRGEVVDESALRAALERGHLAGAGLDVLEHETAGGNPFADLPQVIVTPHIAGVSKHSIAAVMQVVLGNLNRYVQGEPPLHPVPGAQSGHSLVRY
jgi:D-3-phosphoglycerate dehydrogenase